MIIGEIIDALEFYDEVYRTSKVWILEHATMLKNSKEIRLVVPAKLYGDILESVLKLI